MPPKRRWHHLRLSSVRNFLAGDVRTQSHTSRVAQILSAQVTTTLSLYFGGVGFRGNICRWMIFASMGFKPKSRSAFSMALRAW